jgi:hypothetical protein
MLKPLLIIGLNYSVIIIISNIIITNKLRTITFWIILNKVEK